LGLQGRVAIVTGHGVRAVEKPKTAQRASLLELDALFASLHRAFRGQL
jgi:hypothetical protein